MLDNGQNFTIPDGAGVAIDPLMFKLGNDNASVGDDVSNCLGRASLSFITELSPHSHLHIRLSIRQRMAPPKRPSQKNKSWSGS